MSKEEIREKIRQCVKQMPQGDNVNKILLFGSHLHGNSSSTSDIDLLVELQENIGLFDFVAMQEELSKYLRKTVDLGQPDALSKYIKDAVLKEAEVIYERS